MNIRKLEKSDYMQYIKLINDFRSIGIDISREKFEELYDTIFKSSIIFVIELNDIIILST